MRVKPTRKFLEHPVTPMQHLLSQHRLKDTNPTTLTRVMKNSDNMVYTGPLYIGGQGTLLN